MAPVVDEVRFIAGRQQQVVAETAVERGQLDVMGPVPPGQAQVDMTPTFQGLGWIAALKSGGGGVHAVGKQLVVGGRALAGGHAGAELPLRRQVQDGGDRAAERRKATGLRSAELRRVGVVVTARAHSHLLGAQACGQVALHTRAGAPGPTFQHKNRRLLGARAGHKRFLAQRRKA